MLSVANNLQKEARWEVLSLEIQTVVKMQDLHSTCHQHSYFPHWWHPYLKQRTPTLWML